MSVNVDFKVNLWTVVVLAAAILLFANRFKIKDDTERWLDNYNTLNGEHTEFVSKHDSMMIYKDNIIRLTQKELSDALKSDSIQRELVKKYKKAAAVVKVEWEFHPKDTVEIEVPIYIEKDTTVHVKHDCFTVDLSAKNGGLSLANLYIENRQDIVLGERRTRLWATEQAFDIRNTNPCIQNIGVTTYTVVVKKRWYEKWWITVPSSFATGYIFGRMDQ